MAHECIGEIALLVYNILQQQWSTSHGVDIDVGMAAADDVVSVAWKATLGSLEGLIFNELNCTAWRRPFDYARKYKLGIFVYYNNLMQVKRVPREQQEHCIVFSWSKYWPSLPIECNHLLCCKIYKSLYLCLCVRLSLLFWRRRGNEFAL